MRVLYGLTQYETPGLLIPDCQWQDIVDLCDAKRTIVRHREDKWQSGWLSPAILRDGATSRQMTDVVRMAAWFGGDIDHASWTLETLLQYLGSLECVIYSTTRSSTSERRWRFLTPLSRETTVSEFTGVWRAINLLLDGEVDSQTKNCNRLHYLPATWIGGNNEYYVQDGETLDVDQLLQICPAAEPTYYSQVYQTEGVRAPDGTDIITRAMIDKHMLSGRAGGRFIRLLSAAATYYKANGWVLTASELANAGLTVSPKDSSGMSRAMGAHREAERALSYINSRVETVSAKDKLLANMKWWYSQAEA